MKRTVILFAVLQLVAAQLSTGQPVDRRAHVVMVDGGFSFPIFDFGRDREGGARAGSDVGIKYRWMLSKRCGLSIKVGYSSMGFVVDGINDYDLQEIPDQDPVGGPGWMRYPPLPCCVSASRYGYLNINIGPEFVWLCGEGNMPQAGVAEFSISPRFGIIPPRTKHIELQYSNGPVVSSGQAEEDSDMLWSLGLSGNLSYLLDRFGIGVYCELYTTSPNDHARYTFRQVKLYDVRSDVVWDSDLLLRLGQTPVFYTIGVSFSVRID